MPMSWAEFNEELNEVQEAVIREYGSDEGLPMPFCHVMHLELGLGQTPVEDAEERAAKLSEETGEEVSPDMLDWTVEHAHLHELIRSIMMVALQSGVSGTNLLADMFVVGRRMGLREAASMMSLGSGPVSGYDNDNR